MDPVMIEYSAQSSITQTNYQKKEKKKLYPTITLRITKLKLNIIYFFLFKREIV